MHLCLAFESARVVVGEFIGIVAADGDDAQRAGVIVPAQCRQRLLNMLDVRAMGADEHDEQRTLATEVIAADDSSCDDLVKTKIRGRSAQFQHHGGFC